MKQFDKKIRNALGHYVYALINPLDNKIFYVGKASGNNRAFSHLNKSSTETDKNILINEIRSKGLEPQVEVLRYGLESSKIAEIVEASIIDSIGIDNLTNIVRGHGIENGRLKLSEIQRLYGSDPIYRKSIKEKYMLFFIQQSYSTSLSEIQLYDSTRQFWSKVSKDKRTKMKNGNLEYSIALSIYDSVVVRVYSILDWFEAGATFSTRKVSTKSDRYEFIGNIIMDHPLLGKKIIEENGLGIKANQQGYGYIN